jgi:hypothetical protein
MKELSRRYDGVQAIGGSMAPGARQKMVHSFLQMVSISVCFAGSQVESVGRREVKYEEVRCSAAQWPQLRAM